MSAIWELVLIVWLVSLGAGLLGALTGLGGGVVIVPALTLGFGLDLRYAIGASLVSVIATSSGAAAAYLEEGYTNLRIGMFLEMATTVGALCGAFLAAYLLPGTVAVVFGLMLILSVLPIGPQGALKPAGAVASLSAGTETTRAPDNPPPLPPTRSALARRLRLGGTYPGRQGAVAYSVQGVAGGFGLMFVAGALSGLLGVGSGAVKVLAMDRMMRIPFKVSTTTSNFMIGVTAAASAGVYFGRGYVDPGLAMPVVLGVLPGAMIGAWFLPRLDTRWLRLLFRGVLLLLAVEMIYSGLAGRI